MRSNSKNRQIARLNSEFKSDTGVQAATGKHANVNNNGNLNRQDKIGAKRGNRTSADGPKAQPDAKRSKTSKKSVKPKEYKVNEDKVLSNACDSDDWQNDPTEQ